MTEDEWVGGADGYKDERMHLYEFLEKGLWQTIGVSDGWMDGKTDS